jgi:hypothetical protein
MGLGSSGSLLPSGLHFGAAVLFLIAGALGLAWIAPDLAAGRFTEPRVAGVTHLFTLGWLTTTIFGALYQLLPVALGTPVRWPRAGYASWLTFVPGSALFAVGVARGETTLHHAGIGLLTAGIVIVLVNVGATLRRATRRDVTWWAVAVALAALASTLLLGVVLLHNLHTGFLVAARLRVLSIHLHVALVGWALVMIVGISQRLLPMFLLAHGVDARWAARALTLLGAGTMLLATGLATDLAAAAWAGLVLMEGGMICFLVQARLFFRARVRRRIDVGMRFAATGLVFLALAGLLGPLVLAFGPAQPRIATAYVIAGLLGGIVLYVVGHFYKIVPFLAWIAHYRGRMGREQVPAVADLYSARVATVQWVAMTAGILATGAGTLAGHAHCARVGSLLFGVGVLLFTTQIVRVARAPRRKEA